MQELTFRPADLADIEAIVRFELDIEKALPHRDMFATDGPEFYRDIVQGGGSILLAEDEEGELRGVHVIRYPSVDDEENLGRTLGLAAPDLARVRHLESVFVDPRCRGQKLALRLLQKNILLTEGSGKDILLATVWPGNVASLSHLLSNGYTIRAFARKYGGKPRFVLRGPTGEAFEEASAEHVDAMDLARHAELLSSGHVGTGLLRDDDAPSSFRIVFRRLAGQKA